LIATPWQARDESLCARDGIAAAALLPCRDDVFDCHRRPCCRVAMAFLIVIARQRAEAIPERPNAMH
jgi:hypothetical protein